MDYLNLARPAFYLYCNCKPCSFVDFFSEVMNIKEMKSSKNTQYLSIYQQSSQRCLLLFKVFRYLVSNHTVHVMFWCYRMRSSILKKCWIPFWHGFESHNVNDVKWLLNFWICLKTDSRPPRSSKPHSYTFPITSLPTIWSHVPNVCLETTAAIECLIANSNTWSACFQHSAYDSLLQCSIFPLPSSRATNYPFNWMQRPTSSNLGIIHPLLRIHCME